MSIYEEIKVGDRIVIREGRIGFYTRDAGPLKIVEVTKVTATQLTAGGIRFMRRDGWEYGSPARSAGRIEKTFDKQGERLMTVEEAEKHNMKLEQEQRHLALARQISEVKFRKLPYETLLKLAEVLGIENR